MWVMDHFSQQVVEALTKKPGLTKERLAAALNVENTEEFRASLMAVYDADLIHKVHDKYYPGSLKSY